MNLGHPSIVIASLVSRSQLCSVTVIVSEVLSLPAVCASDRLSSRLLPVHFPSVCCRPVNLGENGVVFPPVSCSQPDSCQTVLFLILFSSPQPLSLVQLPGVFRTYIGVGELERGWGWHSSTTIRTVASGTRDQRLSANSLTEKIPGEESSNGACGGLSHFLCVCLSLSLSITVFAHSVHVTASTHHLIWEKLWAVTAEMPLRLFVSDVNRYSNCDKQGEMFSSSLRLMSVYQVLSVKKTFF